MTRGSCLLHGWTDGRCCSGWSPMEARPYLVPAIQRVLTPDERETFRRDFLRRVAERLRRG